MTCTHWCSDVNASFFHTAFSNSLGQKGGVAFGEKGHYVHDKKAQQYRPTIKFLLFWSLREHQGRLKYNMHLFQMFSERSISKSLLVGTSNFLLFLLSLPFSLPGYWTEWSAIWSEIICLISWFQTKRAYLSKEKHKPRNGLKDLLRNSLDTAYYSVRSLWKEKSWDNCKEILSYFANHTR